MYGCAHGIRESVTPFDRREIAGIIGSTKSAGPQGDSDALGQRINEDIARLCYAVDREAKASARMDSVALSSMVAISSSVSLSRRSSSSATSRAADVSMDKLTHRDRIETIATLRGH